MARLEDAVKAFGSVVPSERGVVASTSPHGASTSRWSGVGIVALVTIAGWCITFVKTGSGLDLSVDDYVARAHALPSVLVTHDPLADYRNWSMLPLVVARLVGADTPGSFSLLQCAIMIVGTVTVLCAVAWRRPRVGFAAALGLFATMTPSYALRFSGSYDQLLLVLLLAVAVVESPALAALLGTAIGLTHAEVGLVALLGLLLLASVGVGAPLRARLWALGGVLAARGVLTVALSAAGQSSDRLTFVEQYGVGRMAGYFAHTWPAIVLSLAAGGWVLLVAYTVEHRSSRVGMAVVAIVAF